MFMGVARDIKVEERNPRENIHTYDMLARQDG